MVEIPQTLINKLAPLGPHFIRVAKHGKEPIDQGWPTNPLNADDPKLLQWLKEGGNYGVVTGFGLTILETDIPQLQEVAKTKLPETFTVLSPGHQGWHLYYISSLDKPIRLRDEKGESVGEVQGPGKMVLGPGSVHPNGKVYQIVNDRPLAQVTREQLIEALKPWVIPDQETDIVEAVAWQERKQSNIDLNILQVVPLAGLHRQGDEYYGPHPVHGSRNGHNFWVNPSKNCWHCFRHKTGGGPLLWLAVEEEIIRCEDAVSGALRGETFKKVLEKAREKGYIKTGETEKPKKTQKVEVDEHFEEGEKKQSQADKLVILASSQCKEFFHDATRTGYVQIIQEGVRHTMPIRSRSFKAWLANLLWQAEGKAPGTEGIYGAINVLEAKALFEGKKYALYNRVAPANDGIWIDMADEQWRAIKVTSEGWEIVDNPPILFKRYSHQLPLVEPSPGGDPWRLLDFFNVDPTDTDTQLTLLCTAISFLIPLIPHPIPILHGIQGSGKTWVFKLLRRLLDPSCIEVLALPRDERERVQQLDHHWLAFYDNVTSIPWWMSDTLCRAATGGGFTKRELYSDDDDIIYNFKRCVGLNGINIAAQRGDLLDRSLLVGLQNIPKEKRRTEEKLLTEFEECKAEILGGFLDTLVKAMEIYPSVNPKGLFRMADFTRWGCAISIALGKTEKDFIDAYETKVKAQIEEAAHASPVATVLLDYMEKQEQNWMDMQEKDSNWKMTYWYRWEGTPTDLFTTLSNHAKALDISTRQKSWPKAPHVLVRQLNELAPSLKSLGWEVTTKWSERQKRICIDSVVSVVSEAESHDKSDANNAYNAISPTSLGVPAKLEDIVETRWDDSFYAKHVCCVCGYEKMTNMKAKTCRGEELWLCNDCYNDYQKQREAE